LKGQKKKGPKVLVNFVKLAKIAISPVLGQSLAEFEVGFYESLIFRPIQV
jgi:hypothetical protein